MAPLEPWEKVLVDSEKFDITVHGQLSCSECHGGQQSADKDTAHTEMVARPSENGETCQSCHPNVVETFGNSLHVTLKGYETAIEARGADFEHPAVQEMFGNHCSSCHTSCGDCHVSQPASVGGGFIEGHVFNETPSMTRNCTACHGSRVGNEYLGKHEDFQADVHFRQGRMTCTDCHSGHEMHGAPADCQECHTGPEAAEFAPADHRYDGLQQPRCETCHAPVTTGTDGIQMHAQHGTELSCQVCHSVAYTSCDGCHVSISEESGNPIFRTEGDYLTFFIGRNPNPTFDRPYSFVPVRHVPISPESYGFYESGLLTDFDASPTWKYATPHNIQLITPQNQTCNSCHGNADIFLTQDKIDLAEFAANMDVYIESIPPLIP
ncbi:MAG: hypothetical protein DWQ07_23805 [Chloroflexi bacterium]|nr:MAG: hypothetical protein DWQ07_23805 [Chloroflexota bacterium]MBL1194173.1 hypothetical protein [Chloroflexota bacterium]NOH11465.1 hypothetical protein [Chloroflexota bacterium]